MRCVQANFTRVDERGYILHVWCFRRVLGVFCTDSCWARQSAYAYPRGIFHARCLFERMLRPSVSSGGRMKGLPIIVCRLSSVSSL